MPVSKPKIFDPERGDLRAQDIYTYLLDRREIWIDGEIYDDVANYWTAAIQYLSHRDPKADIKLFVNSPGGSISAGMAIYDMMQAVPNDVATVCFGQAASMGAVLLAAGAKGKRTASPNSRILLHQPLGGARGEATDIQIQAEEMLRMKEMLIKLLVHHTGRPHEKVERDCDRDHWFDPRQAAEYGIIDGIYGKGPVF